MLQAFQIQKSRLQRSQILLILGVILPIVILTSIAPLLSPLLLKLDRNSENGSKPHTSFTVTVLLAIGLAGNVTANVALHTRFSENYIALSTAASILGTTLNGNIRFNDTHTYSKKLF
ncbi:hypothetical protein K7432_012750 [Basidiobolus ranarum]|uniref:Uncharacterized protein n=1 Tax=Basidiobolus ranarum TaxID=34480 RepID=A0ABR2VRX7_9FUNG